ELPDRDPWHLGRQRRPGIASREGDLDRRRGCVARHLRRLAGRLHPLRREAGAVARRAPRVDGGLPGVACQRRRRSRVRFRLVRDGADAGDASSRHPEGIRRPCHRRDCRQRGREHDRRCGRAEGRGGSGDLGCQELRGSDHRLSLPGPRPFSLLFATPLTFALAPVYIGALLLTGIALWQITGDGEATRFEGVALISLYAILAVLTFYE